ncbi:uncharacterized protein LOC129595526 [Paramacrobiotus metropolitanus]|uniref:uncharacterized protein LOC129595526 n=1 Tax=Paramacrobiotus metropolitanus TaxID=2943436 RepID=UPI00244624B0|nr:uncharacterized protein LOC129595526 [Paramacrobiotus metropolitanus]
MFVIEMAMKICDSVACAFAVLSLVIVPVMATGSINGTIWKLSEAQYSALNQEPIVNAAITFVAMMTFLGGITRALELIKTGSRHLLARAGIMTKPSMKYYLDEGEAWPETPQELRAKEKQARATLTETMASWSLTKPNANAQYRFLMAALDFINVKTHTLAQLIGKKTTKLSAEVEMVRVAVAKLTLEVERHGVWLVKIAKDLSAMAADTAGTKREVVGLKRDIAELKALLVNHFHMAVPAAAAH